MIVRTPAMLRRLLGHRAVAGRDPVELARESVAAGCFVELGSDDVALLGRIGDAGLAPAVELTVPVARLGVEAARRLCAQASDLGFSIALAGPAPAVQALGLPGGRIVVPAEEPDAEDRCRALAGRGVRLVARRRGPHLSFVRCLNVLMAGEGQPGIAVSDPRLIAIAGERAAWYGRTSDSWELVMPYGELVPDRRRLVAAGSAVRLSVGGPS